ncbi:MAG TPA: response regulator [Burkholderiales bacterium]|nr:response regulator [Burkholderiales bacterium]
MSPSIHINCGRRRILVADDEHDTVFTLTELLRVEGHEARGVYSGAAALAAVAEFDPDVVILDLAMPDQSGWEVAREICATYGPHRPVLIAISGIYKQGGDHILGATGGFRYYVSKPYDPGALLRLLENL